MYAEGKYNTAFNLIQNNASIIFFILSIITKSHFKSLIKIKVKYNFHSHTVEKICFVYKLNYKSIYFCFYMKVMYNIFFNK